MQQIYIDASLLGVPNVAVSPEEAEQLFDRVIHLSELVLPSVPIECVINQHDEDQVWLNNLDPSFEQIAAFIDMMGLRNIFSPADVTKAYQTIISFSEKIEFVASSSLTGVPDITIEPGLSATLGPSALAELARKAISDVAQMRGQGTRHILFSGLADTQSSHYSVSLGKKGDDESKHIKVPCITSFSGLLTLENSLSLWDSADSAESLLLSILVGAHLVKTIAGIKEPIASDNILVGRDFLPSLEQNEAARTGRFARGTFGALSRIAAGMPNSGLKPFGQNNQVTRTQDGATGWRCHITKKGIGLRLMIWKKADKLEFANVGPKMELTISYAAPVSVSDIPFSRLVS